MAISHLYPTERPEKTLNFASSSELDPAVTFARATAGTFLSATGSLVVAPPNTPRFNYRLNSTTGNYESLGLLIEGASTNYIRNNTMVGAVAGTPGTLPTNWAAATPSNGLNREIVGTGTINGVDYADIRYSGTTTATSSTGISPDGITAITAVTGQTWTASMFVSISGGSLSGINVVRVRNEGRSSAGSLLESSQVDFTPTSALTRRSISLTLTNASSARISESLIFTYNSGAVIDITLRIGLPQLEQAEFPSSVIRTSSGAASRSADIVNISGRNFSSWYDTTGSMVLLNAIQPSSSTPATGYPRWAQFDRGDGSSNFIGLVRNGLNSSQQQLSVFNSSQQQAVLTPSTAVASDSEFKFAADFSLNDFRASVNGTLAVPDQSGTLPSPTTLGIGQQGNGTLPVNSSVSSILYYPGTSYSDTVLQSLTGGPSPSLWNKSVVLPSYHIDPGRTGSVVDLVTGSNLITFSNAAPAMGFNSAGILVQPAANVPFIEYDPATGACLGWRVWDAVTNLRSYSEAVLVANNYNVINSTLTPQSVSTPIQGVSSASFFALNSGANTGNNTDGTNYGSSISLANSTAYTQSGFFKLSGTNTIRLRSNVTGQVFDIVPASGATTPTGTITACTVQAAPDGWYRVSWSFTTTTSVPGNRGDHWTIKTPVADGTTGFWITGTQINTGALAPYVPTGALTASSTADVASITGAAFAGIWNQAAGTGYSDVRRPSAVPSGSFSRAWQASDATTLNRIEQSYYSNGQVNVISTSATNQAEWYPSYFAENGIRAALAFASNDVAGASNGVITGGDTSVTLPTVDRIFFGSERGTGQNYLNGYIRELAIFKSRLPNSILQYITT